MKRSNLTTAILVLTMLGVATVAQATTPSQSASGSKKTTNKADQLNKKELAKLHHGPANQAKITTPTN